MKTISALALAAALIAGTPALAHMSHDRHEGMNQSTADNGDDNSRKTYVDQDGKNDKMWNSEDHKTSVKYLVERVERLTHERLVLQNELKRLLGLSETGFRTKRLEREIAMLLIEINKIEMKIRTVS